MTSILSLLLWGTRPLRSAISIRQRRAGRSLRFVSRGSLTARSPCGFGCPPICLGPGDPLAAEHASRT